MVERGSIEGGIMTEKILLEFFPKMVMEIPESPDGSCCLNPIVKQSKSSQKMYIIAQHIRWRFKDLVDLKIPSKSNSRIRPVKKYKQFISDWRKKRLGIKKLPALALNAEVLCQGDEILENEIEKKVKMILKSKNN
jgi:hypothetical protein